MRVESGKRRTENGTALALTDRREVKRKVWRFAVGFFVLVMLAGACSSRKKLVAPKPTHADYEWMTAKMSGELKVESGEFALAGSVRMRRDSAIWISASAFLGVEAVRALITPDSVVIVNRLDQTYVAEPLREVAARYQWPATFQETQAMLLGEQAELRFGNNLVKLRFSDVHWNEQTTFPIKINKNYKRIKP